MSAVAATGPLLSSAQAPPRRERAGLRAVALLAVAVFAALQYGGLLTAPPVGRLLAVAATATAGSATLALRDRAGRPLLRFAPLRVLALLITLALALLALGVPAHLLAPGGWRHLARQIGRGVDGLDWLWPYRGVSGSSRLAVLLVVPVVLVGAGGLCFWPAAPGRGRGRRTVALAMLLGLYLTGAANAPQAEPGLRGLTLLGLLAAWLWLPAIAESELTRAARWVIICGVLALLCRAALGAPSPWIGFRDSPVAAPAGVTFQWDQIYGPIDWPRSGATMLALSEPNPGLLRVTSLDRFDGLRFLRSGAAPGSARLDLPRPFAARRSSYSRAVVTIAGLRSRLLVDGGGLALKARWLAHGAPALSREPDGTLAASSPLAAGGVYTVTSYRPPVSPERLRRAPRAIPRAYLPYVRFELPARSNAGLIRPGLAAEVASGSEVAPASPGSSPASDPATAARLAASPYRPMFALARALALGAPSAYDVAVRVQRYLLANYAYDEHVARARYPLEAFLFEQRRGYCQQFSGAMTLLLRMDGIPARVAAGFKPGVYDAAAGSWLVRPVDAHSWVEVFFAGVGWFPFDPTPAAPGTVTGVATAQSKSQILGGSSEATPGAARLTPVPRASATAPGGPGVVALTALSLGGLVAVLLGASWLAGHRRLRRALHGDGATAVLELRRALAAVDRCEEGMTLAQLERDLRERDRAAAGYLTALRERRYGGRERALSRRGRAALRRALGARRRPRARLALLLAMPPGAARRRRERGLRAALR
jgi:protein-glutamine gamma-glutamyltransferase